MIGEAKIDAAEMRTAVGTCIKDPNLQNLFKSAPDGAREVIKLSFYSTVFPEKMDAHRFNACLQAVEPDLTPEDLRYLIRFEDDPEMKSRFVKLLSEREGVETTEAGAESCPQEASPVRKLHVRRKEGGRPAVDLNAEAVKRSLEQNELERLEDEARVSESRRRVRRLALLKTGVSVLVGLVVLAGGVLWLNVRSRRQREQAAIAREATERMRAKEMAEREEKERQRTVRQEQQKAELAARRAEEAAKQAKRVAEQAERDKEAEAHERAREKVRKAQDDVARRFDGIHMAFTGARLLPWSSLPKAQRPGAVEGIFSCLVPDAQGDCGCYEVQSHTNGTMTVVQLTESRNAVDVNLDEWNRKLEAFGGLVHDGRCSYLFLPKQAAGESPCLHEDIQPARMRLGGLVPVIWKNKMNTEQILFDVRVRVPGVMSATTVGEVRFDGCVVFDQISQKIHEVAATKVKKQKPKKVRRTIVLYDGRITKRQINGVTLLPRNPTRVTDQYMTMLAEARRQEEECAAAEQEVVDRHNEQVDKKAADMLNAALISIVVSSPTR